MSPPTATSATAEATTLAPVKAASRQSDSSLIAICCVLASTVAFAAGDTAAKTLTGTLPPVEIAWLRYFIFMLMTVPVVLVTTGRRVLSPERPWLQVARAVLTTGSAVMFITALRFLPVAEATAINFVSPLFITALSIPLLGEQIGVRRWTAALVGFAGVMLVVQPGSDAFSLASFLPMCAALCWATAAITTRMMASEKPEITLAWSAVIGFLILSVLLPFEWRTPSASELGLATIIGVCSGVGQWLIVLAYRRAPASTVAPFSYLQLVSAAGFAYLFLSSVPGFWTWIGGTIIAMSGLYTAHRERVRGRRQKPEDAVEAPSANAH